MKKFAAIAALALLASVGASAQDESGSVDENRLGAGLYGELGFTKIKASNSAAFAGASAKPTMLRGVLGVPIEGSVPLFLAGVALHLFATTSMGIFLATVARTMPQFGLLVILTILPMQMLSGGSTPFESMPLFVQRVMQVAPTTHFVELAQAILYRGAGVSVVWRPYLILALIGSALFALSLARFRKTISQMA